ncbi:hypothetical protein [Carnobacterium antarcticum]|uniref:Uncharacterized protein n=1 Tax=Carnobacterium antarcticum TaxID=2126436 RepID=A0ABW4NLU3_9LACT|nr:hypothetical protein [Carnobacterium sp. CP1]ALV21043.1 hypothetical protein NY10_423 [Carnobacterium sp. CP1]
MNRKDELLTDFVAARDEYDAAIDEYNKSVMEISRLNIEQNDLIVNMSRKEKAFHSTKEVWLKFKGDE